MLFSKDLYVHLYFCQQQYYSSIASRRSGRRWAISVIHKLWQLTHQLWLHRNSVLHETSMVESLHGIRYLNNALIFEHKLGLHHFPSNYSQYFSSLLPTLLSKPTRHKKLWFLLIRSGRESCSTYNHIDEFSTNPVLRRWIGLAPRC